MLAIILFFLYGVSSLMKGIYRIDLRGLKDFENKRIQTDMIRDGIMFLENNVFMAAKQGLLNYTTEPFEGCESFAAKQSGLDKGACENIVREIHTSFSERFPDSEIIYDADTKKYTLEWD